MNLKERTSIFKEHNYRALLYTHLNQNKPVDFETRSNIYLRHKLRSITGTLDYVSEARCVATCTHTIMRDTRILHLGGIGTARLFEHRHGPAHPPELDTLYAAPVKI